MAQKLRANLSIVNVPTDNVAATRDFYSRLLGMDFARTLEVGAESYHIPVSEDGIDLQAGPRRNPNETTSVFFAVDNLDQVLQDVNNAGGRVLWGPQNVDMTDGAFQEYQAGYRAVASRGEPDATKQMTRAAVVQEPGGTQLGLLQLAGHMEEYYQAGNRHQKPITDKQLQYWKEGRKAAGRLHGRGTPGTE